MKDTLKPNVDVSQLEDSDLIMAHSAVHSFWRELEQVGRDIENWTTQDTIRVHEKIKAELNQRGLPHNEMNDLDNTGHATQWAEQFVQTEAKAEFVQENPVEADWYIQAVEAVQSIDESIDVTDYIGLSSVDVNQLDDEHPHDFFDTAGVDGSLVGYRYDEQEDEGIALVQEDAGYSIRSSEGVVYQSDREDDAYRTYSDIKEVDGGIEQGIRETLDVEQYKDKDKYNDNPDTMQVHTLTQQGDGNHVIVGMAKNLAEDFWVCVHTSGSEYQQPDGPSMGPSHGEVGPFASGTRTIPFSLMLEEPIANGQQFFVTLHQDDDGEKGDHFTDDSGNFIFDSATYWHHDAEMEQASPDLLEGDRVIEGEIDVNQGKDYYWYEWDEDEIQEWTSAQGLTNGNLSERGEFIQYEIQSSDRFDELQTEWEGRRSPLQTRQMAGGEKPRRVTYGTNENDERVVQSIEFRVKDMETRPIVISDE